MQKLLLPSSGFFSHLTSCLGLQLCVSQCLVPRHLSKVFGMGPNYSSVSTGPWMLSKGMSVSLTPTSPWLGCEKV